MIYLNNDLEIYEIDLVKQSLSKLFHKKNTGKGLGLFNNFDNMWAKIQVQINLKTNIYFLVGENAGFTDTRVIYIWIKNQSLFYNTNIHIINIKSVDIKDYSSVKDLLSIESDNTTSLKYSRDPRIG